MPFLENKTFWKDLPTLKKGFDKGGEMHTAITEFRKGGRALQTSCFLIIPERLEKDDDLNLIWNLLLRTQRLIDLADDLWNVVHDDSMTPNARYDVIAKKILAVRCLGETWVKMLMVVIDIAMPHLNLLRDRCEVGNGAADPLRKMLEEEGLLPPKPVRQQNARLEKTEEANVSVALKYGVAFVKRDGKQLIQVTEGMAGSLDRAHEIARLLAEIANASSRPPAQEVLIRARQNFFDDHNLKVPALGLDKQAKEAREAAEAEREKAKAFASDAISPSAALRKLKDRINAANVRSARPFWNLIAEVETHARKYWRKWPKIVMQMKTQKQKISAVTLQVQLCEFRQFENFLKKGEHA
jgi:hypothetical protein